LLRPCVLRRSLIALGAEAAERAIDSLVEAVAALT
jgi:hypothetical protein